MKSKLLQEISHGESREVVNGQEENTEDSPLQWRGRGTLPKPAVDAEARKLDRGWSSPECGLAML